MMTPRRFPIARDLWMMLLAGVVAGCLGVLAFGVVHAVLITPIWAGLLRGLPFAALGGAAAAWAFYEARAAGRFAAGRRGGLLFGSVLWLALAPVTAVDVVLRKTGLRTALGDWEVLVSAVVALAGGFAVGWVLARRRRAALALSLTTLVLAAGMGGPVAVTGSQAAAGLFAGFLLIYTLCGGLLVLVYAGLHTLLRHRNP